MQVNGKHYRTVWMEGPVVCMIDQTRIPFDFAIFKAETYRDCCFAIRTMITRGAGAIGATAGFAMAQAFQAAEKGNDLLMVELARNEIEATRPTARDLFYAVDRVYRAGLEGSGKAMREAQAIADENVEAAMKIGNFGNELIEDGFRIETHCNAGWLGFVDYGSATAPIYRAKEKGKNIFVYVDETRPRGQGARLTAWELNNENIPHAVIADNAGAYYMSKGQVDMMIVGADRIAANGDVANKIGTLEKAIVAEKYNVPFYVAAPLSTFDPGAGSGSDIAIEHRSGEEVVFQEGLGEDGKNARIRVTSPGSDALNPAFDVTPANLITGIITDHGIIHAEKNAIAKLFGHDRNA